MLGPLLWHWENSGTDVSVELDLEQMKALVEEMGFEIRVRCRLTFPTCAHKRVFNGSLCCVGRKDRRRDVHQQRSKHAGVHVSLSHVDCGQKIDRPKSIYIRTCKSRATCICFRHARTYERERVLAMRRAKTRAEKKNREIEHGEGMVSD